MSKGGQVRWVDGMVDACIDILRKSPTYRGALGEIQRSVHPGIGVQALNHKFTRMKIGPPTTYVAADMVPFLRKAEPSRDCKPGGEFGVEPPKDGTGLQGARGVGLTRILVIPDAHIPYHDVLAWETALAVARDWRPDVLVLLGDLIDCYDISDFTKDPARKQTFRDEIEAGRRELKRLAALRIPRTIYLSGNHERRLETYVAKRAPELHGYVNIAEMLGVKDLGFEWVPYGETVALGKILVAHDFGACGRYAVSRALDGAGHCVVFGHTHRAQCEYGGLITGERHVSWSMGWLGDYESLAFSYTRKWKARRDWTHGVGTIVLDETGCGWVQFHPILSGRVVVGDRMISGRVAA